MPGQGPQGQSQALLMVSRAKPQQQDDDVQWSLVFLEKPVTPLAAQPALLLVPAPAPYLVPSA